MCIKINLFKLYIGGSFILMQFTITMVNDPKNTGGETYRKKCVLGFL